MHSSAAGLCHRHIRDHASDVTEARSRRAAKNPKQLILKENGGPGGPAESQENQQLNPVWDEDPIL